MAAPKQSRGYANKNPGNIDWSAANKWQGQVGIETRGNPPRFAVFESHEYGIRALAALLTTYYDRHGLRTVRAIISRWAPPVENSTSAYVAAVAKRMKRGADERLDLHSYADMRPLVEAIITHELGGQPYSDAVLDEGLRLAGLPRPVTTIAEAAQTGTGRGAGAVAAAVAVAAPLAPILQTLGDLPQWTAVAVVASAALVALAVVLTRRKAA